MQRINVKDLLVIRRSGRNRLYEKVGEKEYLDTLQRVCPNLMRYLNGDMSVQEYSKHIDIFKKSAEDINSKNKIVFVNEAYFEKNMEVVIPKKRIRYDRIFGGIIIALILFMLSLFLINL